MSQKKQSAIKGNHAFFDLKQIILSTKDGIECEPIWVSGLDMYYLSLFVKEDRFLSFSQVSLPEGDINYTWKYNIRSLGIYIGLLRINKKAKLTVIFSVPKDVKLNKLSLNIK